MIGTSLVDIVEDNDDAAFESCEEDDSKIRR